VRRGELRAEELAPLRLRKSHGGVLLVGRALVVTHLAIVPVQSLTVLGGCRDGQQYGKNEKKKYEMPHRCLSSESENVHGHIRAEQS
jgi:hypothetical protein